MRLDPVRSFYGTVNEDPRLSATEIDWRVRDREGGRHVLRDQMQWIESRPGTAIQSGAQTIRKGLLRGGYQGIY